MSPWTAGTGHVISYLEAVRWWLTGGSWLCHVAACSNVSSFSPLFPQRLQSDRKNTALLLFSSYLSTAEVSVPITYSAILDSKFLHLNILKRFIQLYASDSNGRGGRHVIFEDREEKTNSWHEPHSSETSQFDKNWIVNPDCCAISRSVLLLVVYDWHQGNGIIIIQVVLAQVGLRTTLWTFSYLTAVVEPLMLCW